MGDMGEVSRWTFLRHFILDHKLLFANLLAYGFEKNTLSLKKMAMSVNKYFV